jgi:hypothetical protein
MAREYIAVTLDVPIEDVEVEVQVVSVGSVSVADRVAAIRAGREEATRLDREASLAFPINEPMNSSRADHSRPST